MRATSLSPSLIVDVLELEDAVLDERIPEHQLPGLLDVDVLEECQRAGVVRERAAHDERSIPDQLVDELCVLVPARLLLWTRGRPGGTPAPSNHNPDDPTACHAPSNVARGSSP